MAPTDNDTENRDPIESLYAASFREVSYPLAGKRFRIEAITSSDMVKAGTEYLLHVPIKPSRGSDDDDQGDRPLEDRVLEGARQVGASGLQQKYEVMEAAICASVREIGQLAVRTEEVELVRARREPNAPWSEWSRFDELSDADAAEVEELLARSPVQVDDVEVDLVERRLEEIVAHSEAVGPWRPIQFVQRKGDEDRASSPPRLWTGRLPKGVVEALFNDVWALSTDDGRDAHFLRSFRQPSGARAHG